MDNIKYIFYSIIRFMPSMVKEEVLNVGLIGYCPFVNETNIMTINDFKSKKLSYLGYKIDRELFEISLDSFVEELKSNKKLLDHKKFKEHHSGVFFINHLQTRKLLQEDLEAPSKRIKLFLEKQYEKYVEKIEPKTLTRSHMGEKELNDHIEKKFEPYIISKKLKPLQEKDKGFNHLLYEFQNGNKNIIGKLSLDIPSNEGLKDKILATYGETKALKNTSGYNESNIYIVYASPDITAKATMNIDYWLNQTLRKETELIEPQQIDMLEEKIKLAH